MKNAFLCGGSALAVAASLWAVPAFADTATDQASQAGMVGEITVIAQKREENIETVPVAITAFSDKQREILGIKNTQDLSNFTPGLSYFNIADRAYIRGVGRNTTNLATASGVATYYNSVYYGANATIALQHDTLFIGNVEVDNGPQNTLHGSNADGGEILYSSNRPTKSFYAEGRLGINSQAYNYLEGVVSGPITDNVRFRLGANWSRQSGGFFNNLLPGPSEGGFGPQGNSGDWHYVEGQVEANFGKLDLWGMVSSGDYDTNYHTVATIGNIPQYEFPSGALQPSGFFGLCAVAGHENTLGCANPAQTIVPGSVTFAGATNASMFPGNNPSNVDPHNFLETHIQNNNQRNDLALAGTATYHFDGFDVEYIGGYQSFYYDLEFGPGYDSGIKSYQLQGPAGLGNLTIFPTANHTSFIEDDQYYSNEVDISSTNHSPFQWLVGAYQYHEHFNQPVGLGCTPNQPQMVNPTTLLGAVAPTNPDGCVIRLDGNLQYDDYAGFAHGAYQFNDQWKLAGGVRYTSDHKYGMEQNRIIGFDDGGLGLPTVNTLGALTPAVDITTISDAAVLGKSVVGSGVAALNTATGYVQRSLNGSWSAVTGDVNVDFTPDKETLAYFRYARGYKSGGFNAGSLGAVPETQPEYVDDFELGLKRTFGSSLLLNATAFYYNYFNDQQPFTAALPGTTATTSEIFNIPEARVFGFEFLGSWRPIDPLTLTLSYDYQNATVTNMKGACIEDTTDPSALLPGANTTGCVQPVGAIRLQNLTGATLPESPPNKVSANAQYAIKFDPGTLTLSGTFVWKDRTYGSIFNRPLSQAPAYDTVDLRAQFDDVNGRYTVSAFVNNVFDSEGFDQVTEANFGTAAALDILTARGLIYPRTFGLEIQYRFK